MWKTNKDYTQAYKKTIDKLREEIDIRFIHVKGHTGNAGNEKADDLAKEACGIMDPVLPFKIGQKPEISDEINERCRTAIEEFCKKDKRVFNDYIKLKSYGIDRFSRCSDETIDEYLRTNGLTELKGCIHDRNDFRKAVRWMMRGLLPLDAVKKVMVDNEIADSCR